ncbi:helix-turn-helix transcriptional regulator [Streptomyces griseofuscus]
MKREKGSTARVAERLGVTQRTVQRYLKGTHQPSKRAAAALEREVTRDWQPRVKDRAEREAAQQGLIISTRARFGFHAAAGTTDDARIRMITQVISPDHSAQAVAAHRAGASEDELQEIIGEALGRAYFRDGGTRAAGLGVRFTDVEYLDVEY